MAFLVRPARLDDAPAIAAVHVQTWRDGYRGVVADSALAALDVDARTTHWRDVLAARRLHVLVAEEAGALFAFVSFGPTRDADMPGAAELQQIYVSSTHWRAGAGASLLAACIDALVGLEFNEVALWVLVDNPRARRFYENHGWRADESEAGRRVVTAGPATGLVEMRYRCALPNITRSP